MAALRRALILVALQLLTYGGKTEELNGAQDPGMPTSFRSYGDIFGGKTAKVSAMGDCDRYRIQIGPLDRFTPVGTASQLPSSIGVVMDTRSGIFVEYVDNDIVVVQTGDIGKDSPGPFMYFTTKQDDRFTVQLYLSDTSTGSTTEFGHPHVIYFEGNAAAQQLKWPDVSKGASVVPMCRNGALEEDTVSIL